MTHHDTLRQVKAEEAAQARVADQMLAAWEVIIPEHRGLTLTPTRQVQLNLLFTKVFNSRVIRWVEFSDRIASNEFLMSKVAGGNIDWALENYEMILAGDYPGGANDSSGTDAAPKAPATPAASIEPTAPTEPTAPIVNGEKEHSHGGLLATRISKPGS